MAITVERKTIEKKTELELREAVPHAFMQQEVTKVYGISNEVPVTVVGVATDNPLTDVQKDQLETAIKNIAGVNAALCLVSAESLAADEIPGPHRMYLQVVAGFGTERIPPA